MAAAATETGADEPAIYASPFSEPQQFLIADVQERFGLDARASARLLEYCDWDQESAENRFLDKGLPTQKETAARAALVGESPNRHKRARHARDRPAVRVARASPAAAAAPDAAIAARFVAAALGDGGLAVDAPASDAPEVAALYKDARLRTFPGDARPRATLALRGSDGALRAAATLHGVRVDVARDGAAPAAHDAYEVVAFAVARADRGAGVGRAFFQAVLLALAASPRPVVVLNLPRPATRGFWAALLVDWDRGGAVEREAWRQIMACAGADFFWQHEPERTLFWSEAADAHLARCSPWFAARRARKGPP